MKPVSYTHLDVYKRQGYLRGKSRKDIVKDFVKILEQEKFRKLGSDKTESEKLKVTKRKVEQQLKKENIQVQIAETNQKIEEKTQKERAVWMKVGPVSYTHLDVYKRQIKYYLKSFSIIWKALFIYDYLNCSSFILPSNSLETKSENFNLNFVL